MPFYLGEFGLDVSGSDHHSGDRSHSDGAEWLRTVRIFAQEHGFAFALWTYFLSPKAVVTSRGWWGRMREWDCSELVGAVFNFSVIDRSSCGGLAPFSAGAGADWYDSYSYSYNEREGYDWSSERGYYDSYAYSYDEGGNSMSNPEPSPAQSVEDSLYTSSYDDLQPSPGPSAVDGTFSSDGAEPSWCQSAFAFWAGQWGHDAGTDRTRIRLLPMSSLATRSATNGLLRWQNATVLLENRVRSWSPAHGVVGRADHGVARISVDFDGALLQGELEASLNVVGVGARSTISWSNGARWSRVSPSPLCKPPARRLGGQDGPINGFHRQRRASDCADGRPDYYQQEATKAVELVLPPCSPAPPPFTVPPPSLLPPPSLPYPVPPLPAPQLPPLPSPLCLSHAPPPLTPPPLQLPSSPFVVSSPLPPSLPSFAALPRLVLPRVPLPHRTFRSSLLLTIGIGIAGLSALVLGVFLSRARLGGSRHKRLTTSGSAEVQLARC